MESDIVDRLRRIGTISDCEVAAAEIERLRNKLLGEENAYDILRLENERLRAERDKARRAWCLYLAANVGLQKEQVANMNGWDCFKEATDERHC